MSKSAFGFDKAEDSPGFLLWQTTITWQRMIKRVLDAFAISHAQFVVLAISLWHEEHKNSLTQTELIRQSKLDKMTVSKSLKKLAENGYLERTEHQHDSRAKQVQLTKKGKQLASKLVPLVEQVDQQFFGVINQAKQQSLIAILNNLVALQEK